MSPRPSVKIQRREEVLTATCEIIAKIGFHRVRVADVADRIGTSTGIVHYYFGTKKDLLDQAFQFAVARARQRSLAALEGVSDPWDRLLVVIGVHLPESGADEWLLWMHLWAEAMVRPELRGLNHASYSSWVDLLEGIVREGQRQGAFADIPPRDFTVQLLTMMDGLVIQSTLRSPEVGPGRAEELLVSFARRSLLTPVAGSPTSVNR